MTKPVALVTGAAGDIGRAIACRLSQEGRHLVLADVDSGGLDEVVREVRSQGGGSATARTIDLSDGSQCVSLIDDVWTDEGPISWLVNAAAVTSRGRIDRIPVQAWDEVVSVNLSAVYWTCRATISHVLQSSRGAVIVNIASIAGVRGLPGSPIYAATKGGVVALSRALAIDHAADGIRVHALAPPAVDTRLYRRMFEDEADPSSARERYESQQGAGRVLKVEEVAEFTAFLCDGKGPVFSPEPIVW